MPKPKSNKDIILAKFLYQDKFTILITLIGGVVIFALIFNSSFPVYTIYIFMFLMMAVSLYRHIRFVQSKNIKSTKTKEGVFVEMGDKKWLEPKKYFQKVGAVLFFYYILVGIFYYYSRKWGITQLLILVGFSAWGIAIKKGIIRRK